MKRILWATFCIGAASFMAMPLASAQNEQASVSEDAVGYSYDWNGKNQRSYFIQWSTDLQDFNYLPIIKSGTGNPLSLGFQTSVPRYFLRLKYTDLPDGGDVNNADFDNDNISNFDEIKVGGSQTDPFKFSTADNGISDYLADSDGNTLADGWELKYNSEVGLFAANGDDDLDSLTNTAEFNAGTDPNKADTDGDGLMDGVELNQSTDPLVNQFQQNPDTIGLINTGPANTFSQMRAAWGFKKLDGSQTQFLDSSGNNFHATRNGNVVRSGTSSGPISYTASFNTASDYLKTSINVTTDTGNGTVAFWFKANASDGPRILFSRDTGHYPMHYAYYQVTSALVTVDGVQSVQKIGNIVMRQGVPHGNNNGQALSVYAANPSVFRIDDGEWHHVVISVTGTSMVLTVDGVHAAAPTTNFFQFFNAPAIAGGVPTNNTGDSGFYFGALSTLYATAQPGPPLNAEIDQILIYDRGLTNIQATALYNYDADGDGVTNIVEHGGGSDPLVYQLDIDGDGLSNAEELAGSASFPNIGVKNFGATNIFSSDTDGDLFDDYWEAKYFSSTVDPNNASKPGSIADPDGDGDGLTYYQEFINGTNPNVDDSDNDGVEDGDEVDFGSNPNDDTSVPLKPSDFYGDETLTSFFPIGALDIQVKAGSGEGSNAIIAEVGDDSSSNSERWRLNIGSKKLVSPTFGELSGKTRFALNPQENHRITLEHVGSNRTTPDYDYTATIDTPEGSPFLLCDPDGLLQVKVQNVDLGDVSEKEAYLIPLDGYSFSESYSGGDAVGPRHRKISLNGRPKPDEKPEQEEESDLADEQSYIDAFNLSLHHDNSLSYMPLAASDLILQATMSSTETGFSDRSGLRPHERFDLPFGAGWSSNLCSYVEVVETIGNEVAVDPVTVNVVDESGRQQRFGTIDFTQFFPWPSTRVDKKTYLNELSRNGDTFQLVKKFGNTLTYTKCDTWFMYSTDRIDGSTKVKKHTYWRLTQVEDRYGVRLNYDYSEPGTTNNVSLIPRVISSPDRPNQFLVIERTSDYRRVASITDSRGKITNFSYNTSIPVVFSGGALFVPRLAEITYADNTTTSYTYSVGMETETDNSDPDEPVDTQHFHTNIESITDKRNNTHTFAYEFDQSNTYWSANASGSYAAADISDLPADIQACVMEALEQQGGQGTGLWKTMYGQSRRVNSVTLPGGIGSSSFARSGSTRYGATVEFSSAPVTTVNDAVGNTTVYEFLDMDAEVVDVDTTEKSVSQEWMIYYLTSKIHHGALAGNAGHVGTEIYTFDKASGLSLETIADISDNVTTWEYENTRTQSLGLNPNSITMSKWADPAAKVDALNRREEYTYGTFRMMQLIDDVYGTTTDFTIDSFGRRSAKNVFGAGATKLQEENYLYNNVAFKGFQTGKEKVAYSNLSNQSWEVDLVEEYTPDSRGRVWKVAIDPGGLNLLTQHAYDLNNNKKSTTDARGNTTSFDYDDLNRLTLVTYPVTGTSAGALADTKEIWYDFNGNKAAEIDEEGNYTIYHYDALNRRVRTIRDMDGLGLPAKNTDDLVTEATKGSATAADLVTEVVYNAVNSVTKIIDPRGTVTRSEYDALRRPTDIYSDDLGAGTPASSSTKSHTQLFYDATVTINGVSYPANSGSTAFNSSAFKPSRKIRHDAVQTDTGVESFITYQVYDALYRPLREAAQYKTNGANFAANHRTSTTSYGAISGGKETLETISTDDRGKQTKTTTDGLQRPITVINALGTSLESTSRSFYTSTGLVWRNIDPLNRRSETEYDAVGRPVKAWSADAISGIIDKTTPANPLLGSPLTETVYDENSNVISTTNPLGNTWDSAYDTRNRKITEQQPAVTNSENPVSPVADVRPQIGTVYDGVGNVLNITDARGKIFRNFYDQAYRLEASVSNPVTGNPSTDLTSLNANDIATSSIFDANGNILALADGNGNITRNTYDALNRLIITATDPIDGDPDDPNGAGYTTGGANDIVIRNQYDDAGNLIQVTDAANQVTAFRYDGFSRKTQTIWDLATPVQRIEQSDYDGLLQTSKTDPQNQTTQFAYDDLHRLEDITYLGRTQDNTHYSYSLVGNLLSTTYPNESAANQITRQNSFTYDKLNRAKTETSSGRTHSYSHDKAGNVQATIYGNTGRFLDSDYDALNRLTRCTEKNNSTASTGKETTYQYALNGNITRKSLPNGSYTQCGFDALNRKLNKNTYTSAGATVVGFDYSQPVSPYPSSYDNVGSVLQVVENYGAAGVDDRTVSNTYDKAYRLDTETLTTSSETTVTDYSYNKANNRTAKTVSVNGSLTESQSYVFGDTTDGYNSNQLKSVTEGADTTSFTYTANGNRASKLLNAAQTQSYLYDYNNRLVSVTDGALNYQYLYDHRTRRVERDESLANGQSTQISFSGGTSAQEIESNATTVEYIRGSDYGGGIGGILYTIRSGNRSYNAYNSRGDVVSQTGDSENITWQAAYEAFGTRTEEDGTNVERQKANTKDEDPWGGINEGIRYRDLEFGIFLTRDPLGFLDGPNTYTYVRQSPWSAFDPLGLETHMTTIPANSGRTVINIHTTERKFIFFGEKKVVSTVSMIVMPGMTEAQIGKRLKELNSLANQHDVQGSIKIAVTAIAAFETAQRLLKENKGKSDPEKTQRDIQEEKKDDPNGPWSEETKKRSEPGRDGAESEMVKKRDGSGDTSSTTHKVTKDGEVIHQHEDHKGKHGGSRQFPSEWTGTENIDNTPGSKDKPTPPDKGITDKDVKDK